MPTQFIDGSRVRLRESLSRDFLLHHRVCPRAVADDGALVVATGPDALEEALDDLRNLYGRPVKTVSTPRWTPKTGH
ncbi:MAG: hypothetical protein ACRENU_15615 [Gemmatimonadaceae bacterium]